MALSCGFAAAQPWEAPTGPNVVRNPGFEEVQNGVPADWGGPPEVYSSDASVAHGGQRSLKFANADSGHYALCSQSISLEPGRAYEVRAWVRTRGIAGEDSGASVCVEWSDALGRYLGGCYPDGVKGDSEWAEIVGLTPEMPPEAAHVTVSCYVRKGMTGTAWWDDVSVRLWAEEPLESVLVTPSYRGWVQSDTPGYARVRVRLRGEEIEGGAAAARVRLRLTACDSGEYVAETTVPGAEGDMNLQLPLPRLAPGRYWLDVDALDLSKRDKSRHCADRYALECRSGPLPKVYVDEHRRLIVDGKPFFPLGMYLSGLEAEQLRVYQEAPFNCLMPYQQPNKEEMDLLQGLGLKVIYTIKDYYAGTEWCPDWIKAEADEEPAVRKTVREFRDHPALLAWYLNDERPVSMLPKLEAHQRWVEEEDANHPTWVVLYQVEEIGKYIRTFDVIGADPYPIPSRPAAMAAQWTKLVRDGVAGSRAMWMVPQVFRWPRADRPPSLAEMRAMAWQCIAEGANGLIFYSWFDLWHDQQFPFSQRWPEVKQVAAEVAEMIPVLLSVEAAPEVTVEGPQALHWTARSYRGKGYLFLVNDSPGPISARVRFASPPKRVTRQGKEVEVARDGALAVTLGPLGVSVYEAEG
jgi:hypothetical protein